MANRNEEERAPIRHPGLKIASDVPDLHLNRERRELVKTVFDALSNLRVADGTAISETFLTPEQYLVVQEFLATQKAHEDTRLGRRRLLSRSLYFLAAGGVAIGAYELGLPQYLYQLYQQHQQEEAQKSANDAENKKRQLEAYNLDLEINHVLGTELSLASKSGWHIQYPFRDPRVFFVNPEVNPVFAESAEGSEIKLVVASEQKGTDIMAQDFPRSDGVTVMKLTVNRSDGTEDWITRDTATDIINNRVVTFVHTDNKGLQDNRLYAQISRIKTDKGIVFRTQIRNRVVLSPDDLKP